MRGFGPEYTSSKLLAVYFVLAAFILLLSVYIPVSDAADKQSGMFFEKGINVIPEPQQANLGPEYGIIGSSVKINLTIDVDPFIKNVLEMGIHLTDEKKGIRQIDLEITDAEKLGLPARGLSEGYKLTIEKKKIIIQAGQNAGLFYGAQTLLHLIKPDGTIPYGTVLDWPDLPWRAVHWDTKHHQDRLEYYEEIIPKLAAYKINAIVFEIEDKLAYERHPRIGAPGAFNKQQLRQLADLARKYYIDFVPLVQGLGHVRYILKHPEYAHLREQPESTWQFCPLKDETFKILFDLYDEAIEATGSKTYIHIGGDESYDLATCPACRKKAEKIGKSGIYLIWLNKVAKYLQKKGLQAIIWDDMVLKFNEKDLKKLPKNIIYMRWEYNTTRVTKTALFDKGYKCMVAPATQQTTPLFPNYAHQLRNIAYLIPSGRNKGALGELCTAWDDSGLHMETFWLGFVASAEYAWSGDKPGLDEYKAKFINSFYGEKADELLNVYDILSDGGVFWHRSRGGTFWRRNQSRTPIKLPPLPDANLYFNQEWVRYTTSGSDIVSTADMARDLHFVYRTAENILQKNINNGVKNSYNLQVLLSLVRMMRYNTELLQARQNLARIFLQASDLADKGELSLAVTRLKSAEALVQKLIAGEAQTRDFLQKTWEKSRYLRDRSDLGQPMPYYVDRYRLHFAELSANYDYLFWVEKTNDLPAYLSNLEKARKAFETSLEHSETDSWRQ